MACHVRELGGAVSAPVGAVLEGGYSLEGLAGGVAATVAAVAGHGAAESVAPDRLVTPRAASYFGHMWVL